MTKPRTTTKRLSTSKITPEPLKAKENRYDLSNAGPSVGDKAGKLAGRSMNHVPAQQSVQRSTTSLARAVFTNVIAAVSQAQKGLYPTFLAQQDSLTHIVLMNHWQSELTRR